MISVIYDENGNPMYGGSAPVSPNTNIDDILDKIYSKLPPYMGHGGIVEEEINHYERHELKTALEALLSAARAEEVEMAIAMKGKILIEGEVLEASLFGDDPQDTVVSVSILEERLKALKEKQE